MLLARGSLKCKNIAMYKCLRDGDLDMYDEIENQMLDLATVKGKAFEDSSVEEMEREVISELSHRGLNNPEANFGRQSDDSEAHISVHSSIDYW